MFHLILFSFPLKPFQPANQSAKWQHEEEIIAGYARGHMMEGSGYFMETYIKVWNNRKFQENNN